MKTKLYFSALLCSALVILFSACKKDPAAIISADKTEVETGESIQFSNTSANASSYLWDFGDNTQSTESAPSKIFTEARYYNVKMKAYSKKEKEADETSLLIKVKNVNEKFAGAYTMQGTCISANNFASPSANMSVLSSGTDKIILEYGFFTLFGTVNGNGVTIPNQTVYTSQQGPYSSSQSYSGNGTLNSNSINLNIISSYSYYDSYGTNTVTSSSCNYSGSK